GCGLWASCGNGMTRTWRCGGCSSTSSGRGGSRRSRTRRFPQAKGWRRRVPEVPETPRGDWRSLPVIPGTVRPKRVAPRRVVLLHGDEGSAVNLVLAEARAEDAHAALAAAAGQFKGSVVALEWLGPLGWTRFLWARQG